MNEDKVKNQRFFRCHLKNESLNDFLKGLKISFGMIFGLSLFFGIVYAIGFHSADEILGGTFLGDYKFIGNVEYNGTLNASQATLIGNFGGGVDTTSNLVCDNSKEGVVNYDSNGNTTKLQYCDGRSWTILGESSKYPKSCKDILDNGDSIGDGIYSIDPSGGGESTKFEVFCDMTTDGGGWIELAHFESTTLSITASTYSGGVGVLGGPNYAIQCSKFTDLDLNNVVMRVEMGSNKDYFKPTSGNDLCDMIVTFNKHQWSSSWDGSYVVPTYYSTHLGGSANGWPSDGRSFIPFWGGGSSDSGCCHNTLADSVAWNRAFNIYIREP